MHAVFRYYSPLIKYIWNKIIVNTIYDLISRVFVVVFFSDLFYKPHTKLFSPLFQSEVAAFSSQSASFLFTIFSWFYNIFRDDWRRWCFHESKSLPVKTENDLSWEIYPWDLTRIAVVGDQQKMEWIRKSGLSSVFKGKYEKFSPWKNEKRKQNIFGNELLHGMLQILRTMPNPSSKSPSKIRMFGEYFEQTSARFIGKKWEKASKHS